ncbi:SDR family oxidoreductase [Parendozoicomonas haliclonae]|uniref:3-oxoacyl-[acyl-carrier-protein] reductase FabG n=1 Tax=Parendozoicomonas haliclonae TaxID=1960125 RepID=A0A1X7AJZ4_9GAMM|nr:SDR family oxidoreductase [Parendozoicomonas haliclonae]SMA42705.1 3-oxoacyl-[acyl-carrier-protein] reductase FabG [Parendozoicomonas haliclonae]
MTTKKTIIVTGGASGLGRAICERFGKAGYAVCVADINQQRGDETIAALSDMGVEAYYQPCNVRSWEEVDALVESAKERWGHIDVIVNNAGIASGGRIETSTRDEWDTVVDINLMGVVRGCRAITPLFKEQKSGHIVNIASLAGIVNAPMMSSYNATKTAVVGLSETLRYELAPFGIHTSVVCPAFFQTNLGESLKSGDPHMQRVVDKLLASSSVTAEDVAEDTYKAVQNKTFYVLTHKEGRMLWRLKRYLPSLFKFMIDKGYKKNLQKQGVKL